MALIRLSINVILDIANVILLQHLQCQEQAHAYLVNVLTELL